MLKKMLAIALVGFVSHSVYAAEQINFDVGAFWFDGQVATRQGIEIRDVNSVLGSNYSLNDIKNDLDENGCTSKFIQMSVGAFLYAVGPTHEVDITDLKVHTPSDKFERSYEDQGEICQYKWRDDRQALCNSGVCVGQD